MGYAEGLLYLGETDEKVVVLDADLAGATQTAKFKQKHPDRFFDCGIAEQNMIGIASGLSLSGFTVSRAPSPCSRPAVPSSRSATRSAIRT